MEHYLLTVSCPDKIGIVAAISGFLAKNDGFILESQQFGDVSTNLFFMRIHFISNEKDLRIWQNKFQEVAETFTMQWEIQLASYKMNVVILASKEGHCLNALLNKKAMGNLPIEIPAIISNHRDLEKMAAFYQTPFHYLPVTADTKTAHENKILSLLKDLKTDLVVFARYMQIVSNDFIKHYPAKIINIHHSFLPSFKGSQPYQQAFDHGVKLIGATAHYVSPDLDAGPIIEQEVMRVDHRASVEKLHEIGQDIEMLTLTKAVKWHAEKRIFLNGNKTIVFS